MDTLTIFYFTLGLMAISGGLGFYLGERGMSGVKIDLSNVKTDLEKVKAVVNPQTQTVTVATPIAGPKASDTVTTTVTPTI